MYLKNLIMFMDGSVRDKIYCSHFDFHVFYVWYYLSQQLRKNKFETDGTFDTIFIKVGSSASSIELENRELTISLPFDFNLYENADETVRCQYYLDLMKSALRIASEKKDIPFEELMGYLKSLADSNFIYSWNFKNVIAHEYDLKIRFTCHLSTNDFIIRIAAYDKKSMIPICEGNVVRTKPDEIFFSHISKKIKIKDGRIFIPDKWGTELLSIDLKLLARGHLAVDFCPTPYPDDVEMTEIFKHIQKELRYDNNSFI